MARGAGPLAGIVGGRREWTALITSVLSIPFHPGVPFAPTAR
jgi:hypothetical protein